MNIFLALFFLGIVQGLTEFLPVSSSGHLVIFSKIFGVEESLFVSILLHVATLLSICVVFWRDLWQMIRHPFSKETISIVLATIPTCVIVLCILPVVKSSFAGGLLPLCFALSAVLLSSAEAFAKKKGTSEFSYKTAFFMGLMQGFAVFPGLSRSGTTISAGVLTGTERKSVAKFSFLMSIPIIFLSMLLEIFEICTGAETVSIPAGAIALAFVTAFLVGIFAIKLTMKITEKAGLKWFSVYLTSLAIVSLFII